MVVGQLPHAVNFTEHGLLVIAFIDKSEHEAKVAAAMTINSPMMGMASAASGVLMSPIVISSLSDVADGSQFIDEIMNWSWPDDIPYYLVFSYQSGKGSDGTVKLESQIPVSLQQEATKVYGFSSAHAVILTDPDFISSFRKTMEPTSPWSYDY